jgi:hypothetical protein
MPPLTTSALSTEVLESALLTLEQISTRLTVLALNTSRTPQQSPRVRGLMNDLLQATNLFLFLLPLGGLGYLLGTGNQLFPQIYYDIFTSSALVSRLAAAIFVITLLILRV